MKKYLFLSAFCFFTNSAFSQLDSILYHDGQMESQWGSSTTGDKFGCFVRITPPVYPATLRGIRGYFRNASASSTIKWKVWSDPNSLANGGVNTIYMSTGAITNPAAGGIANQDYSAYADLTNSNIVINSGDIYIGAVQTVDFFGAGIDNLPNSAVATDRQWQWMNVFNVDYWNTLSSQASSGQFGFTAFFSPFTTGINENADNKINLSIDPENNILNVWLSSVDNNTSMSIFDITGKKVEEKKIIYSDSQVDMSQFADGMYLVVIISDKKYFSGKIAKY